MPMPRFGTRVARSRRGNATYTAIIMLAMFGFGALTVDIGHDRMVKAQIQAACDAGAHAGAAVLDGTATGLDTARTTAVAVAGSNKADGNAVVVDPYADVTFGVWDSEGRTFTESADPKEIDAVYVQSGADVKAYFAPVAFGRNSVHAGASAIAKKPGREPASATDCFLPLGIPSCMLDQFADGSGGYGGLASLDIVLNPAGADNAGWAEIGATPSASYVKDQFLSCTGSGEAKVGDSVGLNNGEMTSALMAMTTALESSSTTWDDTALGGTEPKQMAGSSVDKKKYGHTLEGPIMIFQSGPEYCTGKGGSFNGYQPLAGFVWAAVYDVRYSGAVDKRTIALRLDLSRKHDYGTDGGGTIDLGIEYSSGTMIVR